MDIEYDNMTVTEAIGVLIGNAEVGPDPRMKGTTDCYLVTLDDMDNLRQALARATVESVRAMVPDKAMFDIGRALAVQS